MKKNIFIVLLVAFVATMLVGCKPKNVDIDNTLKQISEETFAKTPSRSFLAINGNDLRVVEYTFDSQAKTAVRKEVNFTQKAAFDGAQTENFTYSWGEFNDKMYGRSLQLTGGNGNRTLTYLNDQLNDGDIVTTISEPRADVAADMITGLTKGKWTGVDSIVVKELIWVDTTVYETHREGKKIIVDTIFKRMPRPGSYINRGIDSCFYYTYNFENGATSKTASLTTEFQRNIVNADTTLLKQHQNPAKYDTIIKYTVTAGTKVFRQKVDYASWSIGNITVTNGEQSLDVLIAEQSKEPETLSISAYTYTGTKGSFVLNNMTYIYEPKN